MENVLHHLTCMKPRKNYRIFAISVGAVFFSHQLYGHLEFSTAHLVKVTNSCLSSHNIQDFFTLWLNKPTDETRRKLSNWTAKTVYTNKNAEDAIHVILQEKNHLKIQHAPNPRTKRRFLASGIGALLKPLVSLSCFNLSLVSFELPKSN